MKKLSGSGVHYDQELASTAPGSLQAASPYDRPQQHFEVGVTRFFGLSDIGSLGLAVGWAEPENGHNWTDGCHSVFDIALQDPGEACTIEISGDCFFHELMRSQSMIMYVNGFHVGRWRFVGRGPFLLSATIEPEQFFRRGALIALRCSWSFPDTVSPAALGISDDKRELGFCFRTITLHKDNRTPLSITLGQKGDR